MKRAGFTMIELIFVIVILGILAAVAVPKLVGVKAQAEEGNIKAFVGTLNRTVGPSKWSASLMDGDDGSIKTGSTYDITTADTEMPKDLLDPAGASMFIDVSYCVASDANATVDDEYVAKATIGDTTYYILCRDGSASQAPKFWYSEVKTSQSLDDTKIKLP